MQKAEIYVASSPFLRCVQTTAGVLDGAKVPESSAIHVHDELSELLMQSWFPENPLGTLNLDKTDRPEFVKKYSRGRTLVYKKEECATPKFPEDINENYERLHSFFKKMKERMVEASTSPRIVLMCSHLFS